MKLEKRVKEFIEDKIETIKLRRWEELFDYWYQTVDINWFEDDEQFKQLLTALSVIGVSKESTYNIRVDLVTKYFEEIVQAKLDSNVFEEGKWYIHWVNIIANLQSALGLSTDELYDILADLDVAGITADITNKRFEVEL